MDYALENISPLDGRYAVKLTELRPIFSESGLMRYRLIVEIEWFIHLCNEIKLEGTKIWRGSQVKTLRSIYESFDLAEAQSVKEIEKVTNHDVKAIEYYIKENLKGSEFEDYLEFIHFGCTSEDINNLSYALMLREALAVIDPVLISLVKKLYQVAVDNKAVAMMSRTHGQPATPTTLGKEFINYVARLEKQIKRNTEWQIMGKMNGAVGNFNAHLAAYPRVDWIQESKKFIHGLGLEYNLYTTQIEPHDYNAEIFDNLKRINTVLTDLNRDVWAYISIGYFKQKTKEGEVGSSTMPHKVNPIDFENSEGNLGLANALLSYFSEKLPISRWQRDLTDSTTLRNMGSAFAYSMLAYKNCIQGLEKLEVNDAQIKADLDNNWELLAEPIQTIMRKNKIKGAYEKLKELSRGKKLDAKKVREFIETLELPEKDKTALLGLSPDTYTGLAEKLVTMYKPLFK